MAWNLFYSKINPSCIKNEFTRSEYNRISKTTPMVNSTTLYKYYKTLTDDPITYVEFYTNLRKYFYFDKFVCSHGTEFLYYVSLNDIVLTSSIPDDIIGT